MPDNQKVQVTFQGKPDKEIPVAAFAYDAQGKLLAQVPIGKDGKAVLPPEAANAARVVVGPVPQAVSKDARSTLKTVRRLGAIDLPGPALEIPAEVWKNWLLCFCNVQGHVVRPVTIGDVTYNKPVCHARVHIFEVEEWPVLVYKLPDDVIRRIRDELFIAVEKPFPRPLPDPPPFVFDPRVRDLSVQNLAKMQPQVSALRTAAKTAERLQFPREAALAAPAPRADSIPFEARAALSADSAVQLRPALLKWNHLIRPYFCWWPWLWPYFFEIEEVAVVDTDDQGRFHAVLPYLCSGDHPDLYFRVDYSIGGTWQPVYHPPVACHTWWNYPCGTDVTLPVNDPRVPWCGGETPLPGKQVAWLLIGNRQNVSTIKTGIDDEGQTANGWAFGGSLEPHIWFGDDLRIPDSMGRVIDHYRLSYRRFGSTGPSTGPLISLDSEVVRHFAVVRADGTSTFKPFVLGPDPAITDVAFRIRPQNPTVPPGAVSASWAPEVDSRSNTTSGYFLSHLLEGGDAVAAAGKYELFLELLYHDGTVVNWTTAGIAAKVPDPSISAPFGLGEVSTIPAPVRNLKWSGAPGTSDVVGMRVVVQVDNNPCIAVIGDMHGTGLDEDVPCGFYKYPPVGATVTLSFEAKQQNHFATFSFATYRGAGTIITGSPASAAARVGDTPVNGFTFDLDPTTFIYTKSGIPVSALVETCPNAAFTENLSVSSMITDGWDQLGGQTAIPHAFALAKK